MSTLYCLNTKLIPSRYRVIATSIQLVREVDFKGGFETIAILQAQSWHINTKFLYRLQAILFHFHIQHNQLGKVVRSARNRIHKLIEQS